MDQYIFTPPYYTGAYNLDSREMVSVGLQKKVSLDKDIFALSMNKHLFWISCRTLGGLWANPPEALSVLSKFGFDYPDGTFPIWHSPQNPKRHFHYLSAMVCMCFAPLPLACALAHLSLLYNLSV